MKRRPQSENADLLEWLDALDAFTHGAAWCDYFAEAETMSTSDELLQQARTAWQQKRDAECTLNRLAKYSRKTDGMRQDQRRALDTLEQSNAALRRILGAQP